MYARRIPSIIVAAAAAGILMFGEAHAVAPGSQLIPCDQADTQVTISVSSHLDPSCTWTRGVEIVASNVELDCQGAHIATTDRRTGILITSTIDVALSNITVRNCHVEGFLNNMRITREGFRTLAEGVEYENAFSDITVEDSTFLDSRGVGIFVDGYVTDVTLRNLHVEGAGSAGIYLEAGSKDNLVENCEIVNNGYTENGPSGQFFDFLGQTFWFWGIGREGISIDGSRDNRILNNTFSGNSAGAIFLYKNCGEFVNQRPERWWHRRYGADGNLIEGNTITGEDYGVWVASRMGENTIPMDCSDPSYALGIVLDYADDNVIRSNVFQNVTYGVRVEDDGNVVADNQFVSDDTAHQAVIIGTRYRTSTLDLPVVGTTISGNLASIGANTHPYRWVYGHASTTFQNNQSLGRRVGMCEGEPPPTGPFVFVVEVVPADPENPPMVDPPPTFPPPEPLPPCPLACTASAPLAEPRIVIRRIDTPPGDDVLSFDGQVTMAHPFGPPLDPVANGVGLLITDAAGGRVLDLAIPGGAYDRIAKRGWKEPVGGKWIHVDRGAAPAGGITRVVVRDLSSRLPGLVDLTVKGKRGSYPVSPANLPLAGYIVLDPPTAETGQCAAATFAGPAPSCESDGRTVKCR